MHGGGDGTASRRARWAARDLPSEGLPLGTPDWSWALRCLEVTISIPHVYVADCLVVFQVLLTQECLAGDSSLPNLELLMVYLFSEHLSSPLLCVSEGD